MDFPRLMVCRLDGRTLEQVEMPVRERRRNLTLRKTTAILSAFEINPNTAQAQYGAGLFNVSLSVMSHYLKVRHRLIDRLPATGRLLTEGLLIEAGRIPQAAVTLVLRELKDDDQLLLIRRARRQGDPWSGHLALPGGRVDQTDADLLITAARETMEEVGIDLLGGRGSRERFIGQLPTLCPTSPTLPPIEITPLIAIAPEDHQIRLSDEVDETWWLSINQLQNAGRSSEYRLDLGNHIRKWPAYPSPGGPIWGITERILTSFLSLLD